MEDLDKIIVTTGDIKEDYEIIGPIYYQISNKGLFGSELGKMIKEYRKEIDSLLKNRQIVKEKNDWGFLYGELSVGQSDFDKAFFIGVMELKKRARAIGGNAIVYMRQDIDIDTNGFQYFYLQIYGTAVKKVMKEKVKEDTFNNIKETLKKNEEPQPYTKVVEIQKQ